VSITLHVVCIECREEVMWGGAYDDGSRWRISTFKYNFSGDDSGELAEAFIFAHRGHVIGLVEDATIDLSETHGVIASFNSLKALLSIHPGTELDEADRVAEPSDLLRGLLDTDRPG
jgi:hypothetical protein